MIARLIASVLLGAVILFIMLFFGLRQYEVHEDGNIRLEIPFLMDDPPEEGSRSLLAGFFIGVVTAAAQYRMLSKHAGAFRSGVPGRRELMMIAARIFIPPVALVLLALLLQGDLLWAVIGITSTLAILAFSRFIRSGRR